MPPAKQSQGIKTKKCQSTDLVDLDTRGEALVPRPSRPEGGMTDIQRRIVSTIRAQGPTMLDEIVAGIRSADHELIDDGVVDENNDLKLSLTD